MTLRSWFSQEAIIRIRTMKTVFNFLLCLTAFAGFAASSQSQVATATPSKFLAGDKAIRLANGEQAAPEIAAGAGTMLAVWHDKRALGVPLAVPSFEWETSSDIYGARIGADGRIIDRVPIAIAQGKAMQLNPQVVWNGSNWLVIFESVDVNGTGFYYQDSLEAVRVSAAGVVLDPVPIKIRNVVPAGSSWTAASDGTDWFVAFQESDMSSALDLLRITSAGVVLQGPKVAVSSTYFLRSNLRLAYANGVFLFTWAEFSDTKALRFDPALNLLDPVPFTLVAGSVVTDLTSDGTQFYAVWIKPVSFVDQVAGARISTTGAVLDPGGDVISNNASSPDGFTGAFVSWDGTNFRVSWSHSSNLYTARVSPTGTVLDPGGVLIPGFGSGPTAATGTGSLQVVWSVLQSGEFDTLTGNVTASNTAGRNSPLGVGAPSQNRSDVAMGAEGAMFVFRSDIAGSNRIMAQPIALNGQSITRNPIQLDAGTNTSIPSAPSVAWNGSVYLATWGNASGIVGQRINQDGTLVDPAPFFVMPGFGPTDAAASGDLFLVMARQFLFNNPQLIAPFVSRVNGLTGAVLDPAGIQVGNSFCISIALTTVGNRWLPVWRSNSNHDNPIGTTYGAFVNQDGTVTPFFSIYGPTGTLGNGVREVGVASDGVRALALQSATVSSSSESDLIGVIVNADGSHGAGINLTPWAGNQYSPKATWNGTHYVVHYNDQKNRFALFTLDPLDARSDLFGMRVTADGVKVDPMGFVFSNSPLAESWPSVTSGNGLTLLAGSVMRNERLDNYRIGYELRGANNNQWPVAVASGTPSAGDVPLNVNFSSAGSTDLDGTIVSYEWRFGDGTTSTSPNPLHTYTVPGEYVATLTVTDNLGATTTNTVRIDAPAPNQPPVAMFTVNPPTGSAPLNVTLVSDGSYDPDGAIGNREWTFSDGGSYFGHTAFHTYTRPGTYTVQLKVFDNDGATGTTTRTVVVQ